MVKTLNHNECYWAIINKLIAEKNHQVKRMDVGVWELFYETGHGHRITYAFVFEKSKFSEREAEKWLLKSRHKYEWTHKREMAVTDQIMGEEI